MQDCLRISSSVNIATSLKPQPERVHDIAADPFTSMDMQPYLLQTELWHRSNLCLNLDLWHVQYHSLNMQKLPFREPA